MKYLKIVFISALLTLFILSRIYFNLNTGSELLENWPQFHFTDFQSILQLILTRYSWSYSSTINGLLIQQISDLYPILDPSSIPDPISYPYPIPDPIPIPALSPIPDPSPIPDLIPIPAPSTIYLIQVRSLLQIRSLIQVLYLIQV